MSVEAWMRQKFSALKNGTTCKCTCITNFKLVRNIWRFPNPFNDFYFLLARKTLIGSGKFPIFVMAQVLHDIFLASKISESFKEKPEKTPDISDLPITKHDHRNYIWNSLWNKLFEISFRFALGLDSLDEVPCLLLDSFFYAGRSKSQFLESVYRKLSKRGPFLSIAPQNTYLNNDSIAGVWF